VTWFLNSDYKQWVISVFGLVSLLSGTATYTMHSQASRNKSVLVIVGIDIYPQIFIIIILKEEGVVQMSRLADV